MGKVGWLRVLIFVSVLIGASSNGLQSELYRGSREHLFGLAVVQIICGIAFFVAYHMQTKDGGKRWWILLLAYSSALIGASINGLQSEINRGSLDHVFFLLAVQLACGIALFVAYRMLTKQAP